MSHNGVVRFFGAIALVIGSGLAYVCIYSPLKDAQAGKESIEWHAAAAGAAIVGVFLGTLMILAGNRISPYLIVNWRTATPKKIIGTAVCVAVVLSAFIYLEGIFESLGYSLGKLR